MTSLGEVWAEFLLLIVVVAQFFCGTASVTSASRMMFAFSRDRAVPGSRMWRKVAANRVPVNAVIAIAVLAWALMLPTLVNGAIGYLVGTSIAVIGLYIAFALPIYLRIRAGDSFQHGAWSLGHHYKWISPVAVVWIALICVLFLMPVSPNGIPGAEEFDWAVVNYAPLTVGGALILFGGWYLLSARHWFNGPVREAQHRGGAHLDRAPLRAVAGDAAGASAPAAPCGWTTGGLSSSTTVPGPGYAPAHLSGISRSGDPPSTNSRPSGTNTAARHTRARSPARGCRPSSAPTRTATARSYGGSPGSSTRSSTATRRRVSRPAAISAREPASACRIAAADRSIASTWPSPMRWAISRAIAAGPQPISITRSPGRSGNAPTMTASRSERWVTRRTVAGGSSGRSAERPAPPAPTPTFRLEHMFRSGDGDSRTPCGAGTDGRRAAR